MYNFCYGFGISENLREIEIIFVEIATLSSLLQNLIQTFEVLSLQHNKQQILFSIPLKKKYTQGAQEKRTLEIMMNNFRSLLGKVEIENSVESKTKSKT